MYVSFIFKSTNESLHSYFSNIMHGEFEIPLMGELIYFLDFQIKQTNKGVFISQTKNCLKFLKKYDMKNANSIYTPMVSNLLIEKDEIRKEIHIIKYRCIIGYLFYLTTSCPNIMFCICMSRFQASPIELHLKTIK